MIWLKITINKFNNINPIPKLAKQMETIDKKTSKFPQNPAFTFRVKHTYVTKSNTKDNIPSPNSYSPEAVNKNAALTKFGTAQRKSMFNIVSKDIPGPGLYEANSSFISNSKSTEKQPKRFFGLSERFSNQRKKIPGPGEYEIKPTIIQNSPKFSLGKKQKTFQQLTIERSNWKPSPGAYHLQKISSYANLSMSMPKSERMKSQKKGIPGPGTYSNQQKLFSSKRSFLKKSSISQQKRKMDFSIKNNSPGPANYDTQNLFQLNTKTKKGFTLRSLLNQSLVKTPGPSQYKALPNYRYKSTSCKISKELRQVKQFKSNKFIPGPGTYNNLTEQYSKVRYKSLTTKFSKSQRKLVDINKSTDQLYYEQTMQLKKTTPSFSIGHQNRKTDKFVGKLNPGPGAYNPQQKLVKQTDYTNKFSQSARMSRDLSNKKIGPGTYKIGQIGKGTGVKFSKSKRGSIFQEMGARHVVISQLSAIDHKQRQVQLKARLNIKFNQSKIKQF